MLHEQLMGVPSKDKCKPLKGKVLTKGLPRIATGILQTAVSPVVDGTLSQGCDVAFE